jgi:D-glycero-D-manno-heptose 1,7-bisphosphate phosphatase
MIDLKNIDKSWTLFLDRDGVINHEKHKDYIHTWDEFVFYEGVPEAMKIFNGIFGHIVVVTNQKGVGKGLTRLEDLELIHHNMTAVIEAAGGRIDKVYFCSDLEDSSPNRKPNPGMGLQATNDFPGIDLGKAIMVGNTISDMEFGRNLGVNTVFLPTTRPEVDITDSRIDKVCNTLYEFALLLKNRQP